jgi:hypothetical protein
MLYDALPFNCRIRPSSPPFPQEHQPQQEAELDERGQVGITEVGNCYIDLINGFYYFIYVSADEQRYQ